MPYRPYRRLIWAANISTGLNGRIALLENSTDYHVFCPTFHFLFIGLCGKKPCCHRKSKAHKVHFPTYCSMNKRKCRVFLSKMSKKFPAMSPPLITALKDCAKAFRWVWGCFGKFTKFCSKRDAVAPNSRANLDVHRIGSAALVPETRGLFRLRWKICRIASAI